MSHAAFLGAALALAVAFVPATSRVDASTDTETPQGDDERPIETPLVEEVEVSAAFARERGDAASFSDLDRGALEARHRGQDLSMLLADTPNAYAYSDAGNGVGYAYLRIRGFDQTRVAVNINGVPLNTPESRAVYTIDLADFAESLDRVQVQRGPARRSSAPAVGGTVNLETGNLDPPHGDAIYTPAPGQTGKDVMWLGTPDAMVAAMLECAARTGPADFVADLGAGDGRIAIAAARDYGARALGIEYDPKMAALAARNAVRAGVGDRVRIVEGDIFKEDFSRASVVTLYLVPELNLQLRPTILAMAPGTRVVSYQFTMAEWEPDQLTAARPGTPTCGSCRRRSRAAGAWPTESGRVIASNGAGRAACVSARSEARSA